MKTKSIFIQVCIVLVALLSFSCESEINEPELTYEEKELLFLRKFRQKVMGGWKVEKMVIAKKYIHGDSKNDSIVYDVGEIFVNNIFNSPLNADRYNQLQAYFSINKEMIPFNSCLLSHPKDDNYLEFDGVMGAMLGCYPFYSDLSPNSSSESYRFLYKYFLGDNYIMILSEDEKTWTWKGLNQYAREIVLVRE
ncbi:hypothetical protein LJB91_02075 [Bacteroidales bacterium OttesenSCG-928-L03]|nr:hypothetical protein [Bacteroidales bacterium OttesenSCG-928-L03]